jgi:hypothetical protein
MRIARPIVSLFLLVAVVACSGGSSDSQTDSGTTTTDGGGNNGVDGGGGTDGGGNTTDGGGNTTDGGGHVASTDGGSPPLDNSGQALLNGMDGITGTFNGTPYTLTDNAKVTDYGTTYNTVLLSAQSMTGTGGSWTITIPKATGTYNCGTNQMVANGDTAQILGPTGTGTASGYPGTDCVMEVKSIYGSIEGRFTALMAGLGGALYPVTAGYFHFSTGLPNCADANDPGVPSRQNGATVSVTHVDGTSGVYRCGENISMALLSSRTRDFDSPTEISYEGHTADNHTQRLTIDGLKSTGTFACGQEGAAGEPKVQLVLGSWQHYDGPPAGGSCSITVTTLSTDLVEGTYTGDLWNVYSTQHSVMSVTGHFRAPRYMAP